MDFSLFHGSCGEVTVAQFLKPTDGAVGPVLHRKKGNVWTENGIKKRERELKGEMNVTIWPFLCERSTVICAHQVPLPSVDTSQ